MCIRDSSNIIDFFCKREKQRRQNLNRFKFDAGRMGCTWAQTNLSACVNYVKLRMPNLVPVASSGIRIYKFDNVTHIFQHANWRSSFALQIIKVQKGVSMSSKIKSNKVWSIISGIMFRKFCITLARMFISSTSVCTWLCIEWTFSLVKHEMSKLCYIVCLATFFN